MAEKKSIYEQIRDARELLILTNNELERNPYHSRLYGQAADLKSEISGLEETLRA